MTFGTRILRLFTLASFLLFTAGAAGLNSLAPCAVKPCAMMRASETKPVASTKSELDEQTKSELDEQTKSKLDEQTKPCCDKDESATETASSETAVKLFSSSAASAADCCCPISPSAPSTLNGGSDKVFIIDAPTLSAPKSESASVSALPFQPSPYVLNAVDVHRSMRSRHSTSDVLSLFSNPHAGLQTFRI